jgi:hypothetical protein
MQAYRKDTSDAPFARLLRIPGEGEKDSGVNVKSVPG